MADDREGPGAGKMITPFAFQKHIYITNTLQNVTMHYNYITKRNNTSQIHDNNTTTSEIATIARWQRWQISALCGMSRMQIWWRHVVLQRELQHIHIYLKSVE